MLLYNPRVRKSRDSQRSRLYTAEWELQEKQLWGQQIEDLEEVDRYIKSLIMSRWWQSKYPKIKAVKLKPGRPNTRACADRTTITLPDHFRWELIILHELAHLIHFHTGKLSDADHGREFAHIYLLLVDRFMGKDAAAALRSHFRAKGVKWHPKRPSVSARMKGTRPRFIHV